MRTLGASALAALLLLSACSGPPPAPEPLPEPAPADTVAALPAPAPVPADTVAAEPDPEPGAVLLATVVDALGGRAAWDSLAAYATEGTSTVQTTYGPTTIETASLVAGMRQIRAEQQTPVGDVLVRVDGEVASLLVDGAPRDPGPNFAASVRSQLLFSVPFVLMNADALTVTRGDDTTDGLAVLIYRAPGVDAAYEMVVGEDGRPVRIESEQPGPMGTARTVHTISGWREVAGLAVPTGATQTSGGREVGSSEITGFTPNPEIPADAFGE